MPFFSPRHNISTKDVSFVLSIFLVLFITACQGTTPTPDREISASDVQIIVATPTEPFPFKTSEPGTVAAHGMLLVLDPMTLVPAPDDAIYLVEIPEAGISSIPQFEEGTVPQAEVDETTGEFMFTNLVPGHYAVVVVTRGGAQIPSRYFETGNFAIFKVEESQADTVLELGKLSLP
jgi:hypothetical protein